MKRYLWLKIICLGAVLGTFSVRDGLSDESNPYLSIVERNPFNLNDVPVASTNQPVVEQPKPPAPKVKLTGLTDLFHKKKALLEVSDPTGGKKTTPLIMIEGESKEGVELVSINMEKNEVVMKIDGEKATLTFETHESTPPPGPGAPGGPGSGKGPKPGSKVTPTGTPRPIANSGINPTPNAALGDKGGGSPVVISSRGSSSGGGVTVAGATGYAPPAGGGPNMNPLPGPSYNATATAEARNQMYNSNTRVVPTREMRTGPGSPADGGAKISQEELRELMIKRKAMAPNLPYPMSPQDQQAVTDILNEKR